MKNIFLALSFVLSISCASITKATEVPAALDLGPREQLTITSGDKVHNFSVEIADTFEEQQRGLMFRDVIAPNEGMLFEYDDDLVLSIWMKNTVVFLDVVFVRRDGSIMKIEHSAKPYSLRSITSEAPVAAVLELAGGQTNLLRIKPGDTINHEFFDGK
ncbi:MAG: DUF192 domain-containing protein [Robiginitomaculum sp.]